MNDRLKVAGHNDGDDLEVRIVLLEAANKTMHEEIVKLQNEVESLRKWQYTVLGASSVVLGLLGVWGKTLLDHIFGSQK